MKDDLKTWLPAFLSEFHRAQLRALGYRKERRTFSRDMGAYWERFNIQGDDYNGVAGWRFYLNAGVEFKDIPARIHWSGFPHTHWTNRMDRLVPGSPKDWEYDEDTEKFILAYTLRQVITQASQVMAGDIDRIRELVLADERKRRPRE
jgi:hypothetical protein